jgi:hypothetical protein
MALPPRKTGAAAPMAGGEEISKFLFTREWQGLDVVGLTKEFP